MYNKNNNWSGRQSWLFTRRLFILAVINLVGFFFSPLAIAQSFTYEELPGTAIIDNTCVTSSIDVSDSFAVTDLKVGINLSHTYRSDLTLSLISPFGNSVQLYSGHGSSADNLDIYLSDSAPSSVSNIGSSFHTLSSPYYEHQFSPLASLSDFDGLAANGTWQLKTCDAYTADSGTVHRIRLDFEGNPGSGGSGPATVSGNGPRNFVERKTAEFKGNFAYVGNSLLRCSSNCTTDNHNMSPMSYVDIDGDSSTFNSSSADVSLPANAEITWAGLYWGGTAGINTSTWPGIISAPAVGQKKSLKFKVPGGSYESVTANVVDTISNNPTTGWSAYQAYADVTDLVKDIGAGIYTVADVQLDRGGGYNSSFTGPNGGWNLVVFYKSDSEQYRRFTIWDGYDFIYFSGANHEFTINSILTPPSGAFETEIAFTCYDGEKATNYGAGDGDFVALGNASQKLNNALNPTTNVCNGTISRNGSNVSSRNPSSTQNWGYDLDRFSISNTGLVPNSANSVTAIFGSDNEGIWFGNLVLSTELFVPPQAEKSFAEATIPAGVATDMTITLENTNLSGTLGNIAFTDTYPAGLKNVSSAVIQSNSCGGSLTANANADSLSFSGGWLSAGNSCSIVVRVVADNSVMGSTIENCTSTITSTSTDSEGESACATVEVTDSSGGISDFGDAPASYGDASHNIVSGLHLGLNEPDAEDDSQHSFNAYGDGEQVVDGSGTWYLSGDEDGAPSQPVLQHGTYIPLFPVLKMTATSYSADFTVTNTLGSNATLFGWIDFDGNGSFDANEAASTAVSNGSDDDSVTLSWSVPTDIQLGTTFIRLRLTTDAAVTINTPANEASDGEVEDFVLAVAMDIPPDSNDITVISGETPLSCQVTVFEDDFDDVSVNGSVFLAPNRGAGGGSTTTLRDWTVSGGGADTYARIHDASGLGMGSAVYLGNGAVRRISPPIGSGFTFDSQGRVTNTIDAIELRDAEDDSTPGSTSMGWGTASHWGPLPVTLSRSFATEVGKTYRLYFKAIPEDQGGSFVAGVMRVDVPGGTVHFKIPASNEGIIDYAIEFTAISTNSTLKFVNYGHVNSGSGLGWCDPASEYVNNPWCTVGGGDGNGNELIIDEVLVAERDCGVGSISGVVYRDSNKNDSYESASENGINAIAVSLYDDKGTADKSDDTLVNSTDSIADGSYSFSNVSVATTYRIEVDALDQDLPADVLIGTANPVTGVVVIADNDTAEQNFGFDPVIGVCPVGYAASEQAGSVTAITLDQGVAYEYRVLGQPEAEDTVPNSSNAALVARNDELIVDLGEIVPGGTNITISLTRNTNSSRVAIATSLDNVSYDAVGTYGNNGTLGDGVVKKLKHLSLLVPGDGARFVKFTREAGGNWIDAVTYSNICKPAGAVSGVVYLDDNGDNSYQTGVESGISSITVSVFDDASGDLVAITNTAADGSYRVDNLNPANKFRILADAGDADLPANSASGTTNPLTGVRVAVGGTTTEQNFGFDVILPPSYTTVGEYRFDDCLGDGSWNLDASGNNNTVTGSAQVITDDFKEFGCTSVQNSSWNMEVPHIPAYAISEGAVSLLIYDHHNVWADTRLLDKGWASDKRIKLTGMQVGDNLHGTVKAELNGNSIETGEVFFTTLNDGSDNDTQWTHVMLTFGGQGMKLYINGVLKGTNSYTGGIDQIPGAFRLPGMSGYFDEFYILDGQPDAVEVETIYNRLIGNKNLDNSVRTCSCKTPYTNNYCVVPNEPTVGLLDLGDMDTTAITGGGSYAYTDRVLPGYGLVGVTVQMSGGRHNASDSAIDSGQRQSSWINENLPSPGTAIYLEPDSNGTATVTYDFAQPTGNVDLLLLDLDYEDTVTLTAVDGQGNPVTDFSGWRYRSGDMSVWQNPDPEDAAPPAWDSATATLSSTDSGNDHRSFGLLTPDTLVRQIVVTFNVPNASGRHIYTVLNSTLRGRDGEVCATGDIAGTVFTDSDKNGVFNNGSESGIPNIQVSLFNNDADTLIRTVSSSADGGYQFTGLSTDVAYRIQVDTQDPDLPVGSAISTANPLAGVLVTDAGVTSDQDFGFLEPLEPFSCDAKLYQTYGSNGQLAHIDLANREFVNRPISAGFGVNAFGYRQSDNLAYGMSMANKHLIVLGNDGVFYDLGLVDGLPVSNSYYVGDFVGDHLYVRANGGQLFFAIDVDARKVISTVIATPTMPGSTDMAYKPSDGLLYMIGGNEQLYSMHPVTGATNAIGPTGLPNHSFGAQFMDLNGSMFAVSNTTGDAYRIDTNTGVSTLIGSVGAASGTNDGFSCSSAVFEFYERSDAPVSGNAPDGVSAANYGSAKHAISGNLKLGSLLDGDNEGIENSTATGDDNDGLDDEDGVFIPGFISQGWGYQVVAAVEGSGGYLQGWIDWNGDGDFSDSGEQIASNLRDDGTGADSNANDGMIAFNVSVPATALRAASFARFRWSSAPNINAVETAPDGEVEDYAITITGSDYGDAPNNLSAIDADMTVAYPTLRANNGARHGVDGVTFLGDAVDADNDGQPAIAADADNDDGVTFPELGGTPVLLVGRSNNMTVKASATGYLNAWIDINQDGDWDDSGEQLYTNQALSIGNNSLQYTPAGTQPTGETYLRFRFTATTVSTPLPTGALSNGEVEDYRVAIVLPEPAVCSSGLLNGDFEQSPASEGQFAEATMLGWATLPDAPDSGSNFAERNSIEIWSSGRNGVPSYEGNQFAEINSVVMGALYQDIETTPGTTVMYQFAHRGRAGADTMDVLIGSPGATVSQTGGAGYTTGNTAWKVYTGSYTVPPGQYITRFSFQATNTASGFNSVGNFIDAVEFGFLCNDDYSDTPLDGTPAPAGSGLTAYGEAKHTVVNNVQLGNANDSDSTSVASIDATGDGAEDDGLSGLSGLAQGQEATLIAAVSGAGGYLQGWIDWNGDGDFADTIDGVSEQVIINAQDNVAAAAGRSGDSDNTGGQISVSVSVPVSAITTQTFARFRWSSDFNLDAVTAASDGEVEDYTLTILPGYKVTGIIFEDLNYGGGAGRSPQASSGVGINGATVELYNNAGELVQTVVTSRQGGNDGAYSFDQLLPGDYYVRVVSDTVDSSRAGSTGNEIPVMTYRSDGTTAVTNEVGGRYPALADASANTDASLLNTSSFIFNSGSLNTMPAQALQPITLSGGTDKSADFGFNFNTVVNTNESGQGSLQQFVQNNNTLGSNGIAQQLPPALSSDYTTGDTVAVFMIPANQLNNTGDAIISSSQSLNLDSARIIIDGRMQTENTGNGNIVLQGNGSGVNNGVNFSENTDGSILRNIAIRGFGGSGVVINGTGVDGGSGVHLEQTDIRNNGQYGVLLENNAESTLIYYNEIKDNNWAGIANDAHSNNTFSQNSLSGNGGLGIDLGIDGVTANSNTDAWLNYPELTAGSSVNTNGSRVVAYDFMLDVPANTHGYRVEFFSNEEVDPSGHGEGLKYLGYVDVSVAGTGSENFKSSFNSAYPVPEDANIALVLIEKTGPDPEDLGATSEFSAIRNGDLALCTSLLTNPDAELPTVTIDENSGNVTYLEALDENGDPITYVISGGADGEKFVINPVPPDALFDCLTVEFIKDDIIGTRNQPLLATTRAVPPTSPPGNYESPTDAGGDNNYDLVITATDIHGNQVTK
ncbi:MAG: GEVED domain-containing protein, partial [Thiolinea sp.]